mgnify:CR=1 FL=1
MDGNEAAKGQAPARAPPILQGKGTGKGLTTLAVSSGCNTGTDEDTEIEKTKLHKGRYMRDKGTDAQNEGEWGYRKKQGWRLGQGTEKGTVMTMTATMTDEVGQNRGVTDEGDKTESAD